MHTHAGETHTHSADTHTHGEEAPYGASGNASVMADVGGDVGALVLYVPDHLLGLEIEIRASGAPWEGRHTAVRERDLGSSVTWAAFFGSLGADRYVVRVRGAEGRELDVDVEGGRVTEVTW